eukprot:17760-Heterococcus_DN1.PRE.5
MTKRAHSSSASISSASSNHTAHTTLLQQQQQFETSCACPTMARYIKCKGVSSSSTLHASQSIAYAAASHAAYHHMSAELCNRNTLHVTQRTTADHAMWYYSTGVNNEHV